MLLFLLQILAVTGRRTGLVYSVTGTGYITLDQSCHTAHVIIPTSDTGGDWETYWFGVLSNGYGIYNPGSVMSYSSC